MGELISLVHRSANRRESAPTKSPPNPKPFAALDLEDLTKTLRAIGLAIFSATGCFDQVDDHLRAGADEHGTEPPEGRRLRARCEEAAAELRSAGEPLDRLLRSIAYAKLRHDLGQRGGGAS